MLKREYPTSSLVAQADAQLRALAPKRRRPRPDDGANHGWARHDGRPGSISTHRPRSHQRASTNCRPYHRGRVARRHALGIAQGRSSRPRVQRGTVLLVESIGVTRINCSSRLPAPRSRRAPSCRQPLLQGPLARTVRVGSPNRAPSSSRSISLARPRFSTFPLYDPYDCHRHRIGRRPQAVNRPQRPLPRPRERAVTSQHQHRGSGQASGH
jgi:hypothetical protein